MSELPEQASQHEANKMVRVLTGEQLKYTNRIHRKSGEVIELQSMNKLTVTWNEADRCLWIQASAGYGDGYPVTRFEEGDIILCEENPGFVERKK